MERFLAEATTAYWWIAVVAMSLLLNVASAYIKAPLDRIIGAFSARYRARKQEEGNEFLRKALDLSRNAAEQAYVLHKELRTLLLALLFLVIAIGGVVLAADIAVATYNKTLRTFLTSAAVGSTLVVLIGAISLLRRATALMELSEQAREFRLNPPEN